MKELILLFPRNDFVLDASHLERVREAAPGYEVMLGYNGVTDEQLARTVICFGAPTKDQLSKMERLKWLHLHTAGADGFTNETGFTRSNVIVTKSAGVFGLPIAEHCICNMLMLSRNMHLYRDQQHSHVWRGQIPETDFVGSNVLILGFGDIGQNLAWRCTALGARVTCVKRTAGEKPDYVDALHTMDALDDLLPSADFVVLCIPGTQKTRGLIDARRLSLMKNTAILVNIGRGSLVDQDALADALKANTIKGAALDVTTPEPLDADNPLWDLPNCFITPHNSGRSPSNESRSFAIFADNLKHFLAGMPLDKVVNASEGY